jgi:hypothetical protein
MHCPECIYQNAQWFEIWGDGQRKPDKPYLSLDMYLIVEMIVHFDTYMQAPQLTGDTGSRG